MCTVQARVLEKGGKIKIFRGGIGDLIQVSDGREKCHFGGMYLPISVIAQVCRS